MRDAPAPPHNCIACDRAARRSLLLPNGQPLRQCPRCRLAWWDWPAFDPASLYDRDYFQSSDVQDGYSDYAALEDGQRRTARARLRRIERLLSPPPSRLAHLIRQARALVDGTPVPQRTILSKPVRQRRLLELGCGTGVFLEAARRSGWSVHGIEVSSYAAASARRRGLNVDCARIESAALGETEYDCVALWDVLEHLTDPLGVLESATRALHHGGVLALSTGDIGSLCARVSRASWHLFNLPEHLFFFTSAALRLLLQRAGCRVSRVTREINWTPTSYLIERLRKTPGEAGEVIRRVLDDPRVARIPNRLVPATLFDVLGVYAVRL